MGADNLGNNLGYLIITQHRCGAIPIGHGNKGTSDPASHHASGESTKNEKIGFIQKWSQVTQEGFASDLLGSLGKIEENRVSESPG